jgi:hypothetical protein
MSTSQHFSFDAEQTHGGKARRPDHEAPAPVKAPHPSVGMLLHMQRTAGNAAVNQLLRQRAAVQRSPAAAETETEENIGERIRSASGRGSGLDAGVQRSLESGLGADVSNVRVHTDGEADHLARSVDSVAFTTGSDIFFRSGAYNPGTPEGMHLLAHEATHTIQQAQGPVAGTPAPGGVSISDPSDSFEQAAEASAASVMAGAAAPAQRMAAGAGPEAVQRAAMEEEEPLQGMRSAQYGAIQREAAPEDEEMQTMRAAQYAAVQREAAPEEEEMQAMRSSQYAAIQREAAPEDEEMQAMRSAQYTAIQREAAPEEEELQTMRAAQYATVQRHTGGEDD